MNRHIQLFTISLNDTQKLPGEISSMIYEWMRTEVFEGFESGYSLMLVTNNDRFGLTITNVQQIVSGSYSEAVNKKR